MNREDIIRMARETGCWETDTGELVTDEIQLGRFADLVASAERERILEICKEGLWDAEGIRYHLDTQARGHVATNDTSQERVDKTSEIVHEPVAWVSSEELLVMRGNALGGAKDWRINVGLVKQDGDVGLYTTPPQRTWVGLTDVEIDQGLVRTNYAMQTAGAWRDGVEWAVKQLQERNT